MTDKVVLLLISTCVLNGVTWAQSGQYVIPELTFSAISPRGFRVELQDEPGVELFAFHGKLNDRLDSSKEGDIKADINSATNGKWVFEDTNLELKVGDKIFYWVYVQYNRAGYTKRDQSWEVKELVGVICLPSTTAATGVPRKICAGNVIFEDMFSGSRVDTSKWTVQKYIPSITDDDHYEFVSYQDRDQNRFIRDSKLYLKPTPALSRNEIFGVLDLSQGCTRSNSNSCNLRQVGGYILPPVVSAKVISTFSFKYGKVEIKAKIPVGDWIYPQVELIPLSKLPSYPKILIAYSRGNRNLTLNSNEDIGNTLLFGGPVSSVDEPARSKNLRSKRLAVPIGRDLRTYTVTWTPTKMDFMLDDELYGTVMSTEYSGFDSEYQIALGVGVGGNYDFPDDIRSGNFQKPWRNFAPRNMKDFYDQSPVWRETWIGEEVSLQVESVKVWAL